MTPDDAKRELWLRGRLRWKLNDVQKPVYDFFRLQNTTHVIANMHRGSGKSYLAGVILLEDAIQGKSVKYCAPTAKMARTIGIPTFEFIMQDIPAEHRPRFRSMDGVYEFPSGGRLLIIGCDSGHAEAARGTDTHIAVLDEEGFMSDPDYVVNDVLLPRVLTVNGKLLHISTPPKSPSHPYGRRIRAAAASPHLFSLPITANPSISKENYALYAAACGGENSTAFRREFLCELITESTDAVFPELLQAPLVPRCLEGNAGIATAFVCDFSGLSFGLHYCFTEAGEIHVLSEVSQLHGNSNDFAEKLRQGEQRLRPQQDWTPRVAVADERIVDDMIIKSRFSCRQDKPRQLSGFFDRLKTMLGRGLSISPECPMLLRHMSDAIWNPGRTALESSGDGGMFEGTLALAAAARHDVRPVAHVYPPDPSTQFRRPAYEHPLSRLFRRH